MSRTHEYACDCSTCYPEPTTCAECEQGLNLHGQCENEECELCPTYKPEEVDDDE